MEPEALPVKLCLLALGFWIASACAAQQPGVRLVGRWLVTKDGATASYAGSKVLLRFVRSSSVSADFSVSDTQHGTQDLYISVNIDGGKPVRIGLSPGTHPALVLATGLSASTHVVAVRKEGEPAFGALRFSSPQLDPGGSWRDGGEDNPIVEVIGDSDATGICALGPDSPRAAAPLFTAAWASQAASWVGALEAELAAVGHPVDMVDLAISGSDAKAEAAAYDYTVFSYSNARFVEYPSPRKYASLVLLWGGANDHNSGGDRAVSSPVSYASLSPFQVGIYRQIEKILSRNPGVKILLLDYIDPTIPDWEPAYRQVMSLFSDTQQAQMFFLPVRDPKGLSDACDVDPTGHPNVALHAAWAGQIFLWMMSNDHLRELGLPTVERWDE